MAPEEEAAASSCGGQGKAWLGIVRGAMAGPVVYRCWATCESMGEGLACSGLIDFVGGTARLSLSVSCWAPSSATILRAKYGACETAWMQ